eukprot:scaffold6317_cov174-Isochrysis_galbana.AAC.2
MLIRNAVERRGVCEACHPGLIDSRLGYPIVRACWVHEDRYLCSPADASLSSHANAEWRYVGSVELAPEAAIAR